jgi:hypothetical protein
MSKRCEGCDTRTTASGSYCRTCRSAAFHARKRIEAENLLVDTAGNSWWVWDRKGEVLVIGKDSKAAAILALGRGDVADEVEV